MFSSAYINFTFFLYIYQLFSLKDKKFTWQTNFSKAISLIHINTQIQISCLILSLRKNTFITQSSTDM